MVSEIFEGSRENPPAPIIPAATVVPLRDGPNGLETLMLRRNSKLAFAGGSWVWPGGRIDPDDYVAEAPDDLEGAARQAAAREAVEEADLMVEPDDLVWFSHWTPPVVAPKRFATYFFAVAAPNLGDNVVTVDMGEIHEHRWITPTGAMQLRDAGEIDLHPPTWITLDQLARYADVESALGELRRSEPRYFATRFAIVDSTVIALYKGDSGYETEDPDLGRPHHRLSMLESGWIYEHDAES